MSPHAATQDADTLTDRLVEEGLIGLAPAAKLFGKSANGRSKHPATLTRYHHEGVRLRDGTTVRLECVRVGSQLMTSHKAVLRFISAQNTKPVTPPVNSPTPATRRREEEAASLELDAVLGISTK